MSISTPAATPAEYVQLPFTTDPNDLADQAITYLQNQWTGWQPNDGDLEVVLIEALAPMAANAAQIAANMPPAALIAFGTTTLGIPYNAGTAATAPATFTVQDVNGPYDIPAGSEVDIGGVAFQTTADLSIPNGSTSGSVNIAANDVGAFANGLSGASWSSINLPVYVTNMTLGAATSGGVDQQDDNAYLNMVAQEMQLRSKSTITLIDFEIVAVSTAGIGRCVAVAATGSPRNINVYVTDPNGLATAPAIKTTLSNTLAGTRMVNAVITVLDPSYTKVSVAYTVLAVPGADPTALQSAINARLAQELSPAPGGWGTPTSGNVGGLTWVDQPVVHLNRIIGVISGVAGVNYVVSCSLSADQVATLANPTLSAALSTGAPITSLPVNALPNPIASGATVTLASGTNTQTWTLTAAAAAGATALAVTSQTPNFAYPSGSALTAPLSTAGAITSLGVAALVNAIPSGSTITLTSGANTQSWTTSAAVAVGATSIPVNSQTPNFAYPSGSGTQIAGPVTGDLTMNAGQSGALPLAGTFTGTINTPST